MDSAGPRQFCWNGQSKDGDNAEETNPEAAEATNEYEESDSKESGDEEESDDSVIEVPQQPKPKSKAQRPREQTFLEFLATLSEDEDDADTSDSDGELAKQVNAPEVDAGLRSNRHFYVNCCVHFKEHISPELNDRR